MHEPPDRQSLPQDAIETTPDAATSYDAVSPTISEPIAGGTGDQPWSAWGRPIDPVPAGPPEPERRRRRFTFGGAARSILAAAALSAVLASASTYALITVAVPRQTAAPVATTGGASSAQLAVSNPTLDVTVAIARAQASVVTITTDSSVTRGFTGQTVPVTGVGSGIVLTANGLILTNNHVISGAQTLTVEVQDGRTFNATVVAADAAHDLAVIKADATGLTPATLADSSTLQVGQAVFAIGSPLGQYTESVTSGIVSALDRTIDVGNEQGFGSTSLSGLIQTDAAINPGNSGGPIIDTRGQVVAISTATSTTSQGLGFAIPIDAAKALITQAGATA